MWRLKKCPKCRGDVYLDKDFFGWYEECLQCGFHREFAVQQEPELEREPVMVPVSRNARK
ncbi:MAG: hypothetical protein IBX68_07500 [Dehalococcoidia bacterium]|nr:hypothetical protein [Dehalococcoidia bacterium]